MFNRTQKNCFLASVSAGALALALSASPASAAGSASSQFNVTANVQPTCLISAGDLPFGNYAGSAVSQSSTISVTCTNTTAYNVALDPGEAPSATVTTRQMVGTAGATLNYKLTTDSAHQANWGQTVGTDTVTGSGNGNAQTLTVYGLLASGQYVAPGAYSDIITATISY